MCDGPHPTGLHDDPYNPKGNQQPQTKVTSHCIESDEFKDNRAHTLLSYQYG